MMVGGKKQVLAGDQPNQQGATSDTKESHPCQCSEDTRKIFAAGVDVINSFVEKYKANDDQSHRLQKSNLRWVKVSACVLTIYTTITALQWWALMDANRMDRESFQKTQQAAVYLGLPDGKFIDFVVQGGEMRVMLYFRNYGAMTARNTRIRLWPVIVPLGAPETMITFLPETRGGQSLPDVGPDILPGFQHTEYLTPSANFRETIDTGKVFVKLVGRLIYEDEFGQYCRTSSAFYKPEVQAFRLQATRDELCDGRPHAVLFCHYGAVQYEMERPDDTWKLECREDSVRMTKIK